MRKFTDQEQADFWQNIGVGVFFICSLIGMMLFAFCQMHLNMAPLQ